MLTQVGNIERQKDLNAILPKWEKRILGPAQTLGQECIREGPGMHFSHMRKREKLNGCEAGRQDTEAKKRTWPEAVTAFMRARSCRCRWMAALRSLMRSLPGYEEHTKTSADVTNLLVHEARSSFIDSSFCAALVVGSSCMTPWQRPGLRK